MEVNTLAHSKKVIIRSRLALPEIQTEVKKSVLVRLQQYIKNENKSDNRFKWTAMSMIFHAGLIMPIVGLIIFFTGNHIIFWGLAIASMYLTFLPSLAGLPVKTVASTFFINILINALILFTAIGTYFFL